MNAARRRLTAIVLAVLTALSLTAFAVPAAYADGHAGLVVDDGSGQIDTYCVAFQGDGISAGDLLAKAGISVVQWNGAVCAVGATGCFQPHDFPSCYCQSYPPTNTYWAFFTQHDDQGWIYSPLGIQSAVAHDGDMQAWRWGVGGPASAPAPAAISFEQVCAAAIAPTATPTSPPPTATPPPPTIAPVSTATPLPTVVPMTLTATATTTTAGSATATATGNATASATAAGSASAAATSSATAPVIANHGSATATPVTGTPSQGGENGGSGAASLYAFVGVAVLLFAAIAAATIYRRRHGH